MTPCSLEHNRIKYLPKVHKIRAQCTLFFTHHEIAHLRCLYLLQCLWHIRIEGWQQSWLVLHALLLQLLTI